MSDSAYFTLGWWVVWHVVEVYGRDGLSLAILDSTLVVKERASVCRLVSCSYVLYSALFSLDIIQIPQHDD